MHGGSSSSSSTDAGRQQALLTQLFKVAQSMGQIDQLLRWLADSIVQQFNVQLIQFWTGQIDAMGLMALQLRTQTRQDLTLPEQIVVNNDLALLAQRMAGERRIYNAQPVEALFSQYRATLLKRYRLNYCTGSFMDAPALLPPFDRQTGSACPFAMTTLIFIHQQPQPTLMSTVNSIVNQAVILAGNRGILLPVNPAQPAMPGRPPQPEALPLTELIPRRRQDTDMLLLNNPFASSAIIADKRARRLYAAIDGRANIALLCGNTGINIKEAYTALRLLLDQRRIDLYEPNGQLVDVRLLPDRL